MGRINLTYALTEAGTDAHRIHHRAARRETTTTSSPPAPGTAYDGDYLRKAVEDKAAEFGPMSTMQDVTTQWGVFALAGPKSRDVLNELVARRRPGDRAVQQALPLAVGARHRAGHGARSMAIRVAYTGELGWELHHPIEMQNYLFDRLMEAGEPHGLKLVGARAQNWLRQEKSYRAFGTELGRDATPLEAGLDRFVDLSQGLPRQGGDGGRRASAAKCVTLLIDGPDDADPWGREALYRRRRRRSGA